MTDTSRFADTLGTAVKVALTQGCAARQAILDMRAALDAGDMDQVVLILRNQTAPGDGADRLTNLDKLIYESLPRESGGEPRSYG